MKVLITGGGGFLGACIARKLVERGDLVWSYSRGSYSHLAELGVQHVQGDLGDKDGVLAATEGMDAIIHVAAKAGVWGDYASYFSANVRGTEHVLAACLAHSIPKLVFTSSPSVVFDGSDQEGWDESAPYPQRFLTAYPATKALAEKAVLTANSPLLATVALRPHLIWGPGDPHLVPRVVSRAKQGKLRLVNGGTKLVDAVFVDNAAQAHLLALDRLAPTAAIAGKAYFITNDEPLPMKSLINLILKAAGQPPVHQSVPESLAFAAGTLAEWVFGFLGMEREPAVTRFVARQLATAHWYNINAAKQDLGYNPEISMAEGMERLAKWFANQSI